MYIPACSYQWPSKQFPGVHYYANSAIMQRFWITSCVSRFSGVPWEDVSGQPRLLDDVPPGVTLFMMPYSRAYGSYSRAVILLITQGWELPLWNTHTWAPAVPRWSRGRTKGILPLSTLPIAHQCNCLNYVHSNQHILIPLFWDGMCTFAIFCKFLTHHEIFFSRPFWRLFFSKSALHVIWPFSRVLRVF